MNIDDIDTSKPLFSELDQLADEYHRLAFFIRRYIQDIRNEEAINDRLVQIFSHLNMNILDPEANVPDMVRGYCESNCTRFPEKLARLPGIKEPLVNGYKECLVPEPPTTPIETLDGIDGDQTRILKDNEIPLTDEHPFHTSTLIQTEDVYTTTLTVDNALVRLGFVRDEPIKEGLSLLLTELDSELDQISALENVPNEELERRVLLKLLTTNFGLSDLKTLCYSLGITYDNIAGDTLIDKARELIVYCRKKKRVDDLKEEIKREHPQLSNELDKKPLAVNLLTRIGQQAIDYVTEALVLLLSFYGRWIHQWDQNLAENILHLLVHDGHDITAMYAFIREMNQLVETRPDDVGETLSLTFQRDEFVSLKQVLWTIKHIFAYEHHYLDIGKNGEIDESSVLRCPEETKRLVLKAKEFITYLRTGVILEEIKPTNNEQEVTKPPIVPEIVRVQRRMTMNDGSIRIDCIHEDGRLRSHRFNRLVQFYYQEESFFYVPASSDTLNVLATDATILPVKIEYPLENKL